MKHLPKEVQIQLTTMKITGKGDALLEHYASGTQGIDVSQYVHNKLDLSMYDEVFNLRHISKVSSGRLCWFWSEEIAYKNHIYIGWKSQNNYLLK